MSRKETQKPGRVLLLPIDSIEPSPYQARTAFDEPEIAVALVIEKGGSGAALASTAVSILNAYFDQSEIGAALLPEGTLLP